MKSFEALQQFWAREGGVETMRLDGHAIEAIERRYGVRFPAEFREYLTNACPKDDFAVDQNCTAWWPLACIKSLSEKYEHPIKDPRIAALAKSSIFFADYMVWCGAWAVACAPGEDYGRVFVISEGERFVAESFAEFVGLYIEDCGALF